MTCSDLEISARRAMGSAIKDSSPFLMNCRRECSLPNIALIDLKAERRFHNKPCEESVPAIQFRKYAIVPEAELAPVHSRSIHLRFRGIGSRSHIARSRRSVVAFHFREASRLWQTEYGPDTYRKTCVSFEAVGRAPRYAQLYRRTYLGNDPNTRQRKAGSLNLQCGAQQN